MTTMTTTGRTGGPHSHGGAGKVHGSSGHDSTLDGVGSGGTGAFDFGEMLLAMAGLKGDASSAATGPKSLKLVSVAGEGLDGKSGLRSDEAANDGSVAAQDAAATLDLAALGLLAPGMQAAVAATAKGDLAADRKPAGADSAKAALAALGAGRPGGRGDVAGLASAAVRRDAGFAGAEGGAAAPPGPAASAGVTAASGADAIDGAALAQAGLQADALRHGIAVDIPADGATRGVDAAVSTPSTGSTGEAGAAPTRAAAHAGADAAGPRASSFAAAMSQALSTMTGNADAASRSADGLGGRSGDGVAGVAGAATDLASAGPLTAGGADALHGRAPRVDTAPVVADIPAHVGSREFAPALGAQVSLMVQDGVQRAELRLNPADMGPIAVQIDLSDRTHAVIHFAAEVATTRAAIEQALPDLASSLRDAGLTLVGGGVSEHPRGQQHPHQQPQADAGGAGMGAGQDGARQQPDARQGDAQGRLAANDVTDPAGRVVTTLRGVVDLLA